MAIDLDALAKEAGQKKGDCVVTRRWLRQVLKELGNGRTAERELDALKQRQERELGPAMLDHDAFARSSGFVRLSEERQ